MDPTKPKGTSVGTITLHINDKFRVSHVEITGRGDLVQKRTIQDSIILVFKAMMHARAQRKQSGLPAAVEEAKKADVRETSRLQNYRNQKAKERKQIAEDLQVQIDAITEKKEVAAGKAAIKLLPGHSNAKKPFVGSKKPVATPAERKAAAAKRANDEAIQIASENTKTAKVAPVALAPKTEDE